MIGPLTFYASPRAADARDQTDEDASMNPAAQLSPAAHTFGFDFHQSIGLALVAVLPALFWTGLIWLVALSLGFAVSAMFAGGLALAIAAFLGTIFRALASGRDQG